MSDQKPRPIRFMELGYSVAEMAAILERWDQMSEAERALVLTGPEFFGSVWATAPKLAWLCEPLAAIFSRCCSMRSK